MTNEIVIAGTRYPVTDKFQKEVFDAHPDLAAFAYSQLETSRDALLRLSNMRRRYMVPTPSEPMAPSGSLTVIEQARLDAITHVINVHHAVNFLQGRPHTDFGFDGVDQVHGNTHQKDCGCVHTYVFDHHKRFDADLTLHRHHDKRLCKDHGG